MALYNLNSPRLFCFFFPIFRSSVETWKAEKVSIWHAGMHDNPFGQRLTALMISKKIPDSSCPMSLLADHPNVQFNYYRPGIGKVEAEMH